MHEKKQQNWPFHQLLISAYWLCIMQGRRSYDSHVLNIMLVRVGVGGREVFGFHLWAVCACVESKQKLAEIDR